MTPKLFTKLVALLIVGLVVVFIIDPLDPSTISTPFLLGIVVMGLSLRQSPLLVATTSLIYCILTVYSLIRGHHYFVVHYSADSSIYFWLFQRAGLFLIVSGLATYLTFYREESNRIRFRMQNILGKLPCPVVISDGAGYIVYINESLCKSFKQEEASLIGKRYVDFFMPDIQEGKAMRYYIELFATPEDSVHELEVKGLDRHKTKVRLTCFGSGSTRVMITAFLNEKIGLLGNPSLNS